MPLRDHYRPPIFSRFSWQGLYGGWPALMVQRMHADLPTQYAAEPRIHLGDYLKFDPIRDDGMDRQAGELGDQYAYEVLTFDRSRDQLLVAAVQIVSPANKDCPANRRAFVAKCAGLLKRGVCVSIVDVVAARDFNLYADMLALIECPGLAVSPNPPPIYAVTIRPRKAEPRARLDVWAYPLVVGQTLPQLPIWLTEDQRVMLDLEGSYEEICRVLRIA